MTDTSLVVGEYYMSSLVSDFNTPESREEGPWKLLEIDSEGGLTILNVYFLETKCRASLGIKGKGWHRTFEQVLIFEENK